jgi:hypothetical protein
MNSVLVSDNNNVLNSSISFFRIPTLSIYSSSDIVDKKVFLLQHILSIYFSFKC